MNIFSSFQAQEGWADVPSVHGSAMGKSTLDTVTGKGKTGWAGANVAYSAVSGVNSGWNGLHAVGAVAGAAVTGPALLPVAASVAAVNSGISAWSLYKTHGHIRGLEGILNDFDGYQCSQTGSPEHECLREVIAFILRQKHSKKWKKGLEVVPAAGSAATKIHSTYRVIKKTNSGERGKERSFQSYKLALHLVTCSCGVADAVVKELFSSADELRRIRTQSSLGAASEIFSKIKSN